MKRIKYCPTCGLELTSYPLLDIYLLGFSCPNNHYFFKTCQEVKSIESLKAKKMQPPASKGENNFDVIEYWLTDKKARAVLNNQIAVLLRRIHEIYKDDRHIIYDSPVFILCPVCAKTLEAFDQPDMWVQGKRCNNAHEFYERGGTIHFSFQGERNNLSQEMSDKTLSSLVDGWLKDNRSLEDQLHVEVRKILARFNRSEKG